MAKRKSLSHETIPLTGRWIPSVDPALIGDTDFSVLKNMRYTKSGIKSVNGMSKINTSVINATYLKGRSAYHFVKDQPSESHVLVQAWNSGETASKVYVNDTAIPNQGDFTATELFTDSSGADDAKFCTAPGGNLAYCNGAEACLWWGDEGICSSFLIYDVAPVILDFTEQIQNTKTDAQNVADFSVSLPIDSYTKLLLHCNGTDGSTSFPDDSDSNHTVTANGNAQVDTAQKMFGTASLLCDGAGDYLSIPDHDDWDFGTGDWTIDFRLRFNAVATTTFPTMFDTGGASTTNAGVHILYNNSVGALEVQVAGVYEQCSWTPSAGTWYHVAVVRTGNTVKTFIDGTQIGSGLDVTGKNITGLSAGVAIGGDLSLGASYYLDGWIDEMRVSKGIARWTTTFSPPVIAYGPLDIYIGSLRPIKGFKIYVGTANTTAGTMSVYEWDGSAWSAVSNLVDGTSSGGITFAQTGSVTFDDTNGTAKKKMVNGLLLYYYKVSVELATSTTVTHCTLDASFQTIKPIWDNEYKDIASFIKYDDSKNYDYTAEVTEETTDEFAELDSLGATTDYLLIGSLDRIRGLVFKFIANHVNTTASTTMTIYEWNGVGWSSVTALDDGTSVGGVSFGQSGVASWTPSDADEVHKQSIAGGTPYYYYKVVFDQAFSADVQLYWVGTIPDLLDNSIRGYKFPMMFDQRLFLFNNVDGKGNEGYYTDRETAEIFIDKVYIGDEEELISGVSLYSQFGSTLYRTAVLCKKSQTWLMEVAPSDDDETYRIYQVSSTLGCIAPLTMAVCDDVYMAENVKKQVAIWQSHNGVVIFDGASPRLVSQDIEHFWDKAHSDAIPANMMSKSKGWYDSHYRRYHLLIASGSGATTLNTELVYDLELQKWFQIDRGSGKYLQFGFPVRDTSGNVYSYGLIDTGYMLRLENGNDFDGNNIVSTFRTKDFMPHTSPMAMGRLRTCMLTWVRKTSGTDATITVKHYAGGATSGTALTTPTDSDKKWTLQRGNGRYVDALVGVGGENYRTHMIEYSVTTSDVPEAFEPIWSAYEFEQYGIKHP